jgi:ADP-ribose pyrophosphatase
VADETGRPRVLSSELVFQGKLLEVRRDEVCLANGVCTERETIMHPGAVVVAALDEERRVVLVSQYRHAVRTDLLELPAGTLEPGEDPLDTARRELREETGLTAARWDYLGSFYSSPGFLREELHAYLARTLEPCRQELEEDEDIALQWVELDRLLAGAPDIRDAKTLAALFLITRRLACEALPPSGEEGA